MNGAGQIDEQGRGRARRKRNGVTGESRREAPALDPSHGEELLALMLPDFVDRDDVRVIEVGGGFGFQLKPIALGLAREFPRRE